METQSHNTPNIFFVGDPHGKYEHICTAVEQHRPDAVVFLGDMDLPAPLEQVLAPIMALTDIWWIHGNHDCDAEAYYRHLFQSGLGDRSLHARVVTVAGVRIAGLGGVFRGQIWNPNAPQVEPLTREAFLQKQPKRSRKGNAQTGGLVLRHTATIFPEDHQTLMQQRADVLVTHEAPSCHRNGFKVLDDLAEALGVHTHFHGHHHLRYTGTVGKTRVEGVHEAGIVDLSGSTIC